MLTVRIRHFAALREARGCAEESVQVAPGTTVAQLYASLFDAGPRIPVAYLQNRAQVPADTLVTDDDEIAFLPPFGGG